ncbi:MAG: dockerin type I domain-containing protein, partial [Chloroflexia bacterium]
TTPTPVCPPTTHQVFMVNTQFSPQELAVVPGSTVSWFNEGPFTHTSTSDTGVWDSGNVNPGFSFQFTFNNPGVYPYHCSIHANMVGTIIVQSCLPTTTPTATATATSSYTPQLVGHVNWEGRPPEPSARRALPITFTLKLGATEVNYPKRLTDEYGFFTITVGTLPNGLYGWRADDSASALHSPNYLANAGTINISGAPTTTVEVGLMRAGDCNDDNVVSSPDFTILKASFGKSVHDPGYDDRADFTGDQTVNAQDYALLKLHFGQSGAPPLSP